MPRYTKKSHQAFLAREAARVAAARDPKELAPAFDLAPESITGASKTEVTAEPSLGTVDQRSTAAIVVEAGVSEEDQADRNLRSTAELAVEAGVSVEDQADRAKELAALVVPVTAAEPEVAPQPTAKVSYTMQLNIWGGVMALLGTAALAVAFLALNAATLGIAGLAVAGVGVACLAASVGLFSHAAKKQAMAERVHGVDMTDVLAHALRHDADADADAPPL